MSYFLTTGCKVLLANKETKEYAKRKRIVQNMCKQESMGLAKREKGEKIMCFSISNQLKERINGSNMKSYTIIVVDFYNISLYHR